MSDEPTTLAGEPARMFVIESTEDHTRTENGKEVKIPVKVREHYVLAVRNGKGYKIWLWCDAASYPKQVKLFTRTLATFEWLDK